MFRATLLLVILALSPISFASELIPHAEHAEKTGQGIVNAYYACPTDRYAHGVLGDRIEAGCLIVEDHEGTIQKLVLPQRLVFEDITPRIADINQDGKNDVVTVRSDAALGAALVIYQLDTAGSLEVLAETPPIGTAFRWLAPAGIDDFNNDGAPDIAYVETPHLGGLLRFVTYRNGGLSEIGSQRGYSNHRIGDSRVSHSRVYDYDKDGTNDLALPGFGWDSIKIVTLSPHLRTLATLPWDDNFFEPDATE